MVTVKGKLTESDRAQIRHTRARITEANKRESDANFHGLASVLKSATSGKIVRKA